MDMLKRIKLLVVFAIAILIFVGCAPSSLISAASRGDSGAVNKHLSEGSNPDEENFLGMTPLMSSARNGHVEIVETLIAAGAQVDTQSESGMTALIAAATEGHLEIVGILISGGADINLVTDRVRTALIEATINQHTAIVQLLLASGADPHVADIGGKTALDWAASTKNETISIMIHAHINNPNAQTESPSVEPTDSSGKDPISSQSVRSTVGRSVPSAVLIALLFIIFRHWPAMKRLMMPFHKQGDYSQAGFVPLRIMYRNPFSNPVFYRFLLPLFTTIYLVGLIVLESRYSDSSLDSWRDIYFIVGIWAFTLLFMRDIRYMVLIVLLPFVVIYILTQSLFSALFGAAIVLSILFAYSYEDNYVFDLTSSRIKFENGKNLDGSQANLLFKYASYPLLLLKPAQQLLDAAYKTILMVDRSFNPFAMLFTIIMTIINSNFQDLELTYTSSTSTSLAQTLASLLVYANVSRYIFRIDVFKFIQVDFLRMLAVHMPHSEESSNKLLEPEQNDDDQIENPSLNYNGPLLSASDRFTDLSHIPTPIFKNAFLFFALDMILTLATLLSFSIIPGVSSEQIATLSVVIKFPLYVVFLTASAKRFYFWFTTKLKINPASISSQEEIQKRLDIQASLESLLKAMMKQQGDRSNYIDISGNKYLQDLAGKTGDELPNIHL